VGTVPTDDPPEGRFPMTHDTEVGNDLTEHLPEGRDPDIAWLLVAAPKARVQPYLYDHAVVVGDTEGEGYGPLTLVVVCGRAGRADAAPLARYQADRLRSGLYVTRQFGSYAAAYEAAGRFHTEGVL